MLSSKPLKPRKCAVCKVEHMPKRIGLKITKVCLNAACVLEWAQGIKAKELKRQEREQAKINHQKKKEFYENDISTRRKYAVEWFNRYIRLRDAGQPCISCGNSNPSIKYDAGHYIPAGSCSALRFNEQNVNLQCSQYCNVHRSGNRIPYRAGLVEKYGQAVVDFLDGEQPIIKPSVEWYRSVEEKYKAKCKDLGYKK